MTHLPTGRRLLDALFGTTSPSPEPAAGDAGGSTWRVPADDAPHVRTWMSWPSRRSIWGRHLGGVQQDIALIARTVAAYEPVVMCAPDDYSATEARASCGPGVTVIDSIPTDDPRATVTALSWPPRAVWSTKTAVRPGVVMVQVPPDDRNDVWARDAREQFAILSAATDARGRRLQVVRVDGPDTVRSRSSKFADSYLNFHLVNGAVITAQFGDAAKDRAARRALAEAFPGREVVQLDVDRLMAGGGGIHCSTMHQPLP